MRPPTLPEIEAAAGLVHQKLPPTPQIVWPLLCESLGAEVWVKHENHTPLGAFKVRGGIVYFHDLLTNEPDSHGVVAATRGNHGQSVAFTAAAHGLHAVIVVPHGNSVEKNAAIRSRGAELIEHGEDFQAALNHAARIADERRLHLVLTFHPALVRGAASFSLELFRSVSDIDTLYVPIGLGSAICGAIATRDALGLRTEIVGVVSNAAPAYARSLAEQKLMSVPVTTTLADGLAVRTPDPVAFDAIKRGVARLVTVSEEEIRSAMRLLFFGAHNVAEGAGATALAGLTQERKRMSGRRVAVTLSGASIDSELFAEVLGQREHVASTQL